MNIKKLAIASVAIFIAQQSMAQTSILGNGLSGGTPTTPNEFLGSNNNYDVILKANNTERMRILSATGNVHIPARLGIGTSAPVTALTIQTGSTNDGVRIIQTGQFASTLGLFNNTGRNWALFSTGSGNGEGPGNFGAYDYSGGGWRYFINGSTGNFALGGTTPQARLHVTGNAIVTSSTGAPASAAYIRGNNNYSTATNPEYTWWNNDQAGIFHPASNVIGFTTAGTEIMRIHSNNNVGIGTNSPLDKLTVENGAIRVSGTNPYGGPMMLFGGNATTAPNGEWGIEYDVYSTGNEGLNFWKPFGSTGTSGNYFLFLSNTGRVGVNTNNAVAQLTVNGTTFIGNPATTGLTLPIGYKLYVQEGILTEKVKVALINTTDWADYVFDKNYKLKTLEEVNSFIKTNKHLPGVPSAEDLKEQGGFDVAKMDAKLLEKIEELTLYIIELNEKNKELAERLAKIEAAK